MEDDVLSVFRDVGVESPVRMLGVVVDEDVLVLGRPDAVVVNLVEFVLLNERFLLCGLRIPRVVEPFVILRPGATGELDPLEMVFQILSGLDVPDVEFPPVGTARREGVHQVLPVVADGVGGQGDRSVLGKRVWVE